MMRFLSVLRTVAGTARSAAKFLAILSRLRRSLEKYRVQHLKNAGKTRRAKMLNPHFCVFTKQAVLLGPRATSQ